MVLLPESFAPSPAFLRFLYLMNSAATTTANATKNTYPMLGLRWLVGWVVHPSTTDSSSSVVVKPDDPVMVWVTFSTSQS